MNKKILVVDDEPSIVKALAMRLKSKNYEVDVAYDGVSAVSKAHDFMPDLILLDVRMPAGSGETVFESLQISAQTMLIPVVFISAHGDDDLKARMKELGAVDFIDKPFETDDLLERVQQVLGK